VRLPQAPGGNGADGHVHLGVRWPRAWLGLPPPGAGGGFVTGTLRLRVSRIARVRRDRRQLSELVLYHSGVN